VCVVALWARGHVTMVGKREATGIEAAGGAPPCMDAGARGPCG
jgi:hypothetical protein